ncbi:MAG: hypothetical protein IJP11_05480 [Oscillospiraceae bacterium]|nr:hypothetical protein [Oscillospiraceae bacterium]
MNVVSVFRSAEDCQQAGWMAVDVTFSEAVTEEQILKWQTLGDLVYLRRLKQPFYRIAGRSFLIKGLEGQSRLRIGFEAGFLPPCDKDAVAAFLRLK